MSVDSQLNCGQVVRKSHKPSGCREHVAREEYTRHWLHTTWRSILGSAKWKYARWILTVRQVRDFLYLLIIHQSFYLSQ